MCTSPLVNGLISTAIGGIIGFFSARYVSQRNIRATASAKLRAAFAPTLATIKIERRKSSSAVLRNNFAESTLPDLAAAIEEFRPFVRNGTAYDKAWDHFFQLATEDAEAAMQSNMQNLQVGGSIEKAINDVLFFA